MPERLTLSIPTSAIPALVYVADDRGYFEKNGLDVALVEYSAGLNAFNGMLNDEADVSLTAEYPVVAEAFRNDNLTIIGNIDKYQVVYLVYPNDTGIEDVADLRGKKIGVPHNSLAEFYAGRYLDLHGQSLENVTIVDVPFSQLATVLANGSVDAVVARDVELREITGQAGRNTTILPIQSYQSGYALLVCKNDWVASHPRGVERLLQALYEAEQYAIDHPAESRKIVQRKNNYTDAFMAETWGEHQYSLSLDQSLITAMEDEGRWMINNNLTSEKVLPDYSDYLYTCGLEKVLPEAVNIYGKG